MSLRIDFGRAVELPGGPRVINCTQFPISFKILGRHTIVVQPCGIVLGALVKEIPTQNKYVFQPKIEPSPLTRAAIAAIEAEDPNLIILGSDEAFALFPYDVRMPVIFPGCEKPVWHKSLMNPTRFYGQVRDKDEEDEY